VHVGLDGEKLFFSKS